jgi:hypothetical protein
VDLLPTVLGSASALLGVLLGGILTARAQRRNQDVQNAFALRAERRDALAAFLASVRIYRRYLMYSDLRFEVIPPSEQSKGTVLAEGRDKLDAALDEAFCRLLVVVASAQVIDEANRLTTRLNDFVAIRAQYGRGNIPTEIIRDFRAAEQRFAELARTEVEET